MIEQIVSWSLKLLKAIFPAAQRDLIASTLLVASLIFELFALSYWQIWERTYNLFDLLAGFFFLLLLLRLAVKKWDTAPLMLIGGFAFLGLFIYFTYRVPWWGLIICGIETVVSFFVAVRYSR